MSEAYDHPLANHPAPPPRGEDLPYDDGEPMETKRHRDQMNVLIDSLDWAWKDRRDYFAGGNMFMYFSAAQAKNNDFRGPDVFVVLDALEKEDRKSWVVWEENGRTPNVVIELLSPRTEKVDRGEKMIVYARSLHVQAYYLYDPWTFVLEGYRLNERTESYERMELDEDGLLPVPPLGLRLGIREGNLLRGKHPWLRWIDADGHMLLMAEEEFQEVERRSEEQLREVKQRAEAEKQRAETEKQRAEAEKQRAETEKQRADALAARLEELEGKS